MIDANVPARTRIALIGCGLMGTAVGHRLLGLGYPLTVYNRTPGKTASLAGAGASVRATPQDAARHAAVVITVVTDDNALRAVLYGPQGALAGTPVAPLVIDLGTHSPAAISQIAHEAGVRGASLVEAPVTGSLHDAQHGTLGFLVGAQTDHLEMARPLLEALGKSVFHFGLPGTGNSAKLAMNLLVGAMARGLSEAIAMLDAQQLSVPQFLAALDESGLASPLYRRIGERHLQGDSSARFSLANLEKDMLLARAQAQALGVSHDIANAVISRIGQMDAAFKQRDYSALISWQTRDR